MRVADRREPLGAGVRGRLQHRDERLAGGCRRTAHRMDVEPREGVVQGDTELPPPSVALRQLGGEVEQHIEIHREPERLPVEHREVDAPESVSGLVTSGRLVSQESRAKAVLHDGGIAGGLEEEVDRLAADSAASDPVPAVLRVDALEGRALRVVEQPLGLKARPLAPEAEVDDDLHLLTGQRLRHHPGDLEPPRRPRLTPRRPGPDRFVASVASGRQSVGDRHRLARNGPGERRQRHPVSVHSRPDVVGQHPAGSGKHTGAVVEHAPTLATHDAQAPRRVSPASRPRRRHPRKGAGRCLKGPIRTYVANPHQNPRSAGRCSCSTVRLSRFCILVSRCGCKAESEGAASPTWPQSRARATSSEQRP